MAKLNVSAHKTLHRLYFGSAGKAIPGRPGGYRLGDMRAKVRIDIASFNVN
ncbi:MAG: hypothetical protein IIA05_04240 [Proteobacteria bacterium]|nr:hypothetical protein [Pseudomonadota bacterium]